MSRTLTAALALTFAAAVAVAQDLPKRKVLSPPATTEATIGGKAVTVNYSAPSKRGRVIFGAGADALVPYGKVWRTGANAATTLETATALTIGDLRVPAGKYSLFTIPGKDEWTLIVNKQTGMSGTRYDETQDLGRTKMKVRAAKSPVETFVIGLDKNLTLTWDGVEAYVPVKAN